MRPSCVSTTKDWWPAVWPGVGMTRTPAAISASSPSSSSSVAPGKSIVLSGSAQPRIERVAQRIAEEVEPEHGEADGDARCDREPRRALEELHARAAEHETPRRRRLEHAEAEERQRRLEQDRLAEERGHHD